MYYTICFLDLSGGGAGRGRLAYPIVKFSKASGLLLKIDICSKKCSTFCNLV